MWRDYYQSQNTYKYANASQLAWIWPKRDTPVFPYALRILIFSCYFFPKIWVYKKHKQEKFLD